MATLREMSEAKMADNLNFIQRTALTVVDINREGIIEAAKKGDCEYVALIPLAEMSRYGDTSVMHSELGHVRVMYMQCRIVGSHEDYVQVYFNW